MRENNDNERWRASTRESLTAADAQELAKTLTEQGIPFRQIPTSNALYPMIFLLSQDRKDEQGPMMRAYRGVYEPLSKSNLMQTAYINRFAERVTDENTKQELAKLADEIIDDPTFDKLAAFGDRVRPTLSDIDAHMLDASIKDIGDNILRGRPLRQELVFQQILHVTYAPGLSPYVVATLDPHEAAVWGGKEIIVIRVPFARVESARPDAGEAAIVGNMGPGDYAAIILRAHSRDEDKATTQTAIDDIMQQVNGLLDPPDMTQEQWAQQWQERQSARAADHERLQKDTEAVKKYRSEKSP